MSKKHQRRGEAKHHSAEEKLRNVYHGDSMKAAKQKTSCEKALSALMYQCNQRKALSEKSSEDEESAKANIM